MRIPDWVRALIIGAVIGGVAVYAYHRWLASVRFARIMKVVEMGAIP